VVTTSVSEQDSYHQRADQEDDKVVTIIDDPINPDDCDISAWVIAENQALSRKITLPEQLFFRDQGERQDGDCGSAAGTLYFVYCPTGRKRTELKSLLTYRTIRQFSRTHLQPQTLAKAAQVNPNQMLAFQTELQCATKDLWTQVSGWQNHIDPYRGDPDPKDSLTTASGKSGYILVWAKNQPGYKAKYVSNKLLLNNLDQICTGSCRALKTASVEETETVSFPK
jgi:hypothetical protein